MDTDETEAMTLRAAHFVADELRQQMQGGPLTSQACFFGGDFELLGRQELDLPDELPDIEVRETLSLAAPDGTVATCAARIDRAGTPPRILAWSPKSGRRVVGTLTARPFVPDWVEEFDADERNPLSLRLQELSDAILGGALDHVLEITTDLMELPALLVVEREDEEGFEAAPLPEGALSGGRLPEVIHAYHEGWVEDYEKGEDAPAVGGILFPWGEIDELPQVGRGRLYFIVAFDARYDGGMLELTWIAQDEGRLRLAARIEQPSLREVLRQGEQMRDEAPASDT